jgi:predicted RND superfamily exporter protein
LFDSFLTALACVTVIMMLALRSVRAGLVAMVPNVFPTLTLFGIMGWLGRPVDIGTVMTASVALGVAVDGTFHFLKWFRYEVDLGKPRREAVAYSYRHCGRALVQTTVICACGLLVFGLSSFLPVRHFALTFAILLVAALVGDLLVLPALLVGPMGNFFVPRRPRAE